MHKINIKKIKSAVLSGLVAVTALAAPLSAAKAPVMTASAASSDNYAKLLQYSLYLYDANMCGTKVNEHSQLTWRSNCHTADDADGGFHDAGDHAMFGLPQGYSASTLGWGYYEFKDAYDSLGQTAHFKTINDHFCDFFKASTKLDGSGNVTNFCYQKGDGNEDHNYWGPPEAQTNNRRQYWTSSGASDIAAEYAAALALSYLNFGSTEDLNYAKALYKFSTQYNTVATDGPYGFYTSDGCTDDQAWAAGWLYLATKDNSYKNDCASKQTQYLGWVHCWNNVSLGAACVYSHITGDWSKVNSYLSGQCNSSNYLFLDKWGSARLNTTMQLCALSATKNSSADYSSWCTGQMNYILGDNPANTCFVVGFADNSAKNPHHRAASGYKSYDEMNNATTISPNGHTLVGALVGGPTDANGTYSDLLTDYICNEVAIDYNAGFVGAAAGLYSIHKTGSLDTSIVGVESVPVQTSTTAPVTTTTTTTTSYNGNNTTTTTTVTTAQPPSGSYEIKVGDYYDYNSMDEKMVGWEWASFGIPDSEKVTKVEVVISSSSNIGKWQGAFGSSTMVAPSYWTQSADMEQTFSGNSGTITWNVDSDTADIIQYNYGGQLKFGIWWIDCGQFTIDSVKVYTNGSAVSTTTTTTKITTTTTTTTSSATTTTTTTTPGNVTLWGDADCSGKVEIADAVKIMCYVTDKENTSIDAAGIANGDVYQTGDGLSVQDALSIQKYLAQIITTLPEA